MNYIRLPQVPKENLEDIYSEPLLVAQKDCKFIVLYHFRKMFKYIHCIIHEIYIFKIILATGLNNILMEIAKTYTSSPKKLENYIGSSFKGRRRTPLNLGTPEVKQNKNELNIQIKLFKLCLKMAILKCEILLKLTVNF